MRSISGFMVDNLMDAQHRRQIVSCFSSKTARATVSGKRKPNEPPKARRGRGRTTEEGMEHVPEVNFEERDSAEIRRHDGVVSSPRGLQESSQMERAIARSVRGGTRRRTPTGVSLARPGGGRRTRLSRRRTSRGGAPSRSPAASPLSRGRSAASSSSKSSLGEVKKYPSLGCFFASRSLVRRPTSNGGSGAPDSSSRASSGGGVYRRLVRDADDSRAAAILRRISLRHRGGEEASERCSRGRRRRRRHGGRRGPSPGRSRRALSDRYSILHVNEFEMIVVTAPIEGRRQRRWVGHHAE